MACRAASLAGVLAGGVGFVSCVLLFASLLILPLSPTSPSKAGSAAVGGFVAGDVEGKPGLYTRGVNC